MSRGDWERKPFNNFGFPGAETRKGTVAEASFSKCLSGENRSSRSCKRYCINVSISQKQRGINRNKTEPDYR